MKNGVGSFRVLFSFDLQTPGEGKLSSDLVKKPHPTVRSCYKSFALLLLCVTKCFIEDVDTCELTCVFVG